MKRRITAIVLSVISLISIALVFTRTPILNIISVYDTWVSDSKYFDYYALAYNITKSRETLRFLTEYYSMKGDNYDKLKPYFDDVFEIRNKYSQDGLDYNAFTYTDEFYVRFLLSNGKLTEADEYCDKCIAEGEYEKIHSLMYYIAIGGVYSDLKNWGFRKLEAIVQSDAFQKNIQEAIEPSLTGIHKYFVWSEYAHALFVRGEYDLALNEIEKMADNKANGDSIIGATLNLIDFEAETNENAKRFIKESIDILENSDCADSEYVERMKELHLTAE